MCLGIPGVVTAIENDVCTVNINDVTYRAKLPLVDNVQIGDFVLVHAGYVLEKLTKEDAQETLRIVNSMLESPLS